MTDGERLRKFHADFAQLKKNREKVPLEQLRTRYAKAYNALVAEVESGAAWYADTYINLLVSHFPRHPRDQAGNEWLDKRLAAIRRQEAEPGRRVERYRAALLDRLNLEEYEQLVWEIYNRLEVEAFDPYWQRHNRRLESGWIYNDITGMFWCDPDRRPDDWKERDIFTGGCWISQDWKKQDTRYPPHIKEE